jgi:hypothetical protein
MGNLFMNEALIRKKVDCVGSCITEHSKYYT